jgi:hypothetical protein
MKKKKNILIIFITAIIFIVFFFVLFPTRFVSIKGFFSPAFSSDGKVIFFIQRETSGIERFIDPWEKPGWFFGSSASKVFTIKDNFYLKKMDIETKKIEIFQKFPSSPLVYKISKRRGGGVFGYAWSGLSVGEKNKIQYSMEVDDFCISKIIEKDEIFEKNTWYETQSCPAINKESSLHDQYEVITLKGRSNYPSAIVKIDHNNKNVEILIKSNEFNRRYPNGIDYDSIQKKSNKKRIERNIKVRTTHEGLVEKFKSQGLSNNEASLKANKEMRNLGYYPSGRTITAYDLSDLEFNQLQSQNKLSPLFKISEKEMRSGIFEDFERALVVPGNPVGKNTYSYITYRGFNNSKELNAFIDSGGKVFYVEIYNKNYRMVLSVSYVACGCGCCGGEPKLKCLYRSKEDSMQKIIAADKEVRKNSDCSLAECSIGTKYVYCD